jgi:hypothetical protein
MKSLAGWRMVWPCAGSLALVIGVFAAPAPVRAGCGDYVVLTPAAEGSAHTRTQAMPTPWDDPAGRAPVGPHGGQGPCRGPGCSRHTAPPLVPVPAYTVSPNEWGCVNRLPFVAALEATGRQVGDVSEHPLRQARIIYHPPRLIPISA